MGADTTDRRTVLECMVWAGAGVLWTMQGGVPRSSLIGNAASAEPALGFSFVQISDSHIGFAKPPNLDTPGTLRDAVTLGKQLGGNASLMIHTGDVSHLSQANQFDTAAQIIGEAGLETHYVPGEHDVLVDEGMVSSRVFTKGGPRGWYSFDQQGVHFIGLNNVQTMKGGGMAISAPIKWPGDQIAGDGTARGYHVMGWVQDGMNVRAVSDLNTAELADFVALMHTR